MFRIHFNALTATWLVQFQVLSIFWLTCQDGTKCDLEFETFDAAFEWAELKGITQRYKRLADPISKPEWGYAQ